VARTTKKLKNMVTITQRAAETLKAIRAANTTDETHVLRIDIEGDGYGLWLGPEQKGDTWVGSEDTLLLRVTPDVIRLFRKTSMVIDCMDHEEGMRMIVYPQDNPPPELSKTKKSRRAATKPNKNKK
jgi:Fe-S cluster assembly iron-binding protein IscA